VAALQLEMVWAKVHALRPHDPRQKCDLLLRIGGQTRFRRLRPSQSPIMRLSRNRELTNVATDGPILKNAVSFGIWSHCLVSLKVWRTQVAFDASPCVG